MSASDQSPQRLPSLQGRLTLMVLVLVAVVWCGTAALTWYQAQHELDELLDSHLAQGAAMLVVRQAHELDDDDDGLAEMPELHRHADRVAFQVWNRGELVMRSPGASAQPMSAQTQGYSTVDMNGRSWRVFAAQGQSHHMQVFVGEELRSRREILWALLRSLAWPMAVMLPLLALATWLAIREGLRPLRSLSQAVSARAPDDLQPLVLSRSVQELAPLVSALNSLFGQVNELLQTERRFTADAAHELRTPIAGVRAQAQVALSATQDEERRHALALTLSGCDRLTRLVEQLLMLSRLEADPQSVGTAVDLSAQARLVAGDLAVHAMGRHQDIEVDGVSHARVSANDTLVGVLLRNLIDNACRYSPDGARVRVRVDEGEAGQVSLTVEDSGPGLSGADLHRLGERFFRVLGTGQSGSGLGWSIVRRIALMLGLAVAVDRSPELGGLRVVVRGWRQAEREA
ncbi:ATP-binding protein [Aquabacterium sp.]|uniref:ATP-binding protein n=1 Tax=Aquabacterium sp. TaxID=1872578 RepID=UPI0035B0A96C